jgi:glutathione synthase/RimK-type ligase-like ATP-grasp enzyme
MTRQIIVVENLEDWPAGDLPYTVVHVDDYLTSEEYLTQKNILVINLCRSYRYLSVGYYCALLAEARRHRVIPSVKCMLDLSSKSMYSLDAINLEEQVRRGFRKHSLDGGADEFEMDIMLGRCRHESLRDLARQIFEFFPCPLLRVRFRLQGGWHINSIKPLPIHRLDEDALVQFREALSSYIKRRKRPAKARKPARYDLAILHDPADPLPPSDARALANFAKAGAELGIEVDLIQRKDYARLAEYDALFIRDTTRINHYTYRFAKKAESEGMIVIDDPRSIQLCTNKVYLAEVLKANRIPAPKTVIVGRGDLAAAEERIGYPMVLKVPDGSFSRGVFKAENRVQMHEISQLLFQSSELVLAQEYLYTEFDWRVGLLNRKPLYACQYFMSKKHWQIVHHNASGGFSQGGFKCLPLEEVDPAVLNLAERAANLIGDGLYGVDIKQSGQDLYVIEINDNPSLDSEVEDCALKQDLYRVIMKEFLRRLNAKQQAYEDQTEKRKN